MSLTAPWDLVVKLSYSTGAQRELSNLEAHCHKNSPSHGRSIFWELDEVKGYRYFNIMEIDMTYHLRFSNIKQNVISNGVRMDAHKT